MWIYEWCNVIHIGADRRHQRAALAGPGGARARGGRVGKAASEAGFFYVSGAGVDDTLFERMLASTKEFFALPLEEKMRSYIGLSQCHRGYVPVGEEGVESGTPDLKEAFDTALNLPADDPDYLAGFTDAVTAYYHAVLDVGHRLLWAFAVALGENRDTFSRHATKTPSQLRLVRYPYNPDAEDGQGIGATPTTNASPCSSPPRLASRCSTARAMD